MSNHSLRKVLAALSVMVTSLALTFISSTRAQQKTEPQPQREQTGTLKTLTLDGKGGTRRTSDTLSVKRPRSLTPSQKKSLLKGRPQTQSFTLTPNEPVFSNKAVIKFRNSTVVPEISPDQAYAAFQGVSDTSSHLLVTFEAEVGRLYALDISASAVGGGTFTITNIHTQATETTPALGGHEGQHVTAYVTAQGTTLQYFITCSTQWAFYSIEVTAL